MRRTQGGAVTTELVLVTPMIVVLMLFAVYAGRVAGARNDVVGAARDAARAASLERSGPAARTAADDAAAATLDRMGVSCMGGPAVATDTAAFRPGGSVAVTVRCDIELAQLALLGIRGSRSVESTSVEVIDLYRGEP